MIALDGPLSSHIHICLDAAIYRALHHGSRECDGSSSVMCGGGCMELAAPSV